MNTIKESIAISNHTNATSESIRFSLQDIRTYTRLPNYKTTKLRICIISNTPSTLWYLLFSCLLHLILIIAGALIPVKYMVDRERKQKKWNGQNFPGINFRAFFSCDILSHNNQLIIVSSSQFNWMKWLLLLSVFEHHSSVEFIVWVSSD